MAKHKTPWSKAPGKRILTRRDTLALGALAATSLYLPGGWIRSARAQAIADYNGLTPDFFISPTGNNGNDGRTPQTAWALDALNSKNYGGNVVGIIDGTYNIFTIFGSFSLASSGFGKLLIAGGSSGSPTIIVSQTRNGATIDWDRDRNSSTGATLQPNGNYVTIDGLHFTGNDYRAINNYYDGGSNVTFKNLLFTDHQNQSSGTDNPGTIFNQGNNNILVQNCRFETCAAPGNNRHAHVYTYDTNNMTIEYCSFLATQNTSGPMLHAKEGAGNTNFTFRHNYCYHVRNDSDVHSHFLWFWNDDSSSVHNIHNNIFFRDASSGGRAVAAVNTNQALDGAINFYNNTFVGPYTSGALLAYFYLGAPAVSFYNNIVSRPSGPGSWGDFDLATIASLGTWNNNLYDSSPTMEWSYNSRGASATGLANWQSVSGKDANSATASDPGFINTGTEADRFRLAAGSLALTLGLGGTQIGAWGAGASQIGSSTTPIVARAAPEPPQLTSVI